MGNSLKSPNSRKTLKLKHSKQIFKEYTKNLTERVAEGKSRQKDEEEEEEEEEEESEFLQEITNYVGLPDIGLDVIEYPSHSFYYDNVKKVATMVMEVLKAEDLKVNVAKTDGAFTQDPNVGRWSTQVRDYYVKGMVYYDKGHMAADRNHRSTEIRNESVNLLSNVIPQHKSLNSLIWNFMEMYTRDIAKKKTVCIVSGPLYIPNEYSMEYEVLGSTCGGIAVPTHFYKVLQVKVKGVLYYSCWNFPNCHKSITEDFVPEKYEVDVEFVERYSGLSFEHLKKKGVKNDLYNKFDFDIDGFLEITSTSRIHGMNRQYGYTLV